MPVTYITPSRTNRGQVSTKLKRQLRERSRNVCEHCCNELATEIVGKGSVHQLVHLCKQCKHYCDTTRAGEIFIEQFRQIRTGEFKC